MLPSVTPLTLRPLRINDRKQDLARDISNAWSFAFLLSHGLQRIALTSSPSLPALPVSWAYASTLLGKPQWMTVRTSGSSTPTLNAIVEISTRIALSELLTIAGNMALIVASTSALNICTTHVLEAAPQICSRRPNYLYISRVVHFSLKIVIC